MFSPPTGCHGLFGGEGLMKRRGLGIIPHRRVKQSPRDTETDSHGMTYREPKLRRNIQTSK